jgi:hypothetical protein
MITLKLSKTVLWKFYCKIFRKEMLNIYYKRMLYFNRSKFENTRLFALTSILKKFITNM